MEASVKAGRDARWAQFPSHQRKATSGSAGAEDSVITRDFADEMEMEMAGAERQRPDSAIGSVRVDSSRSDEMRAKAEAEEAGEHIQHRSAKLGRGITEGFGRSWRTESTAYRLQDTGHRSSIATGGRLEYPELEVISGSVSQAMNSDEASSGFADSSFRRFEPRARGDEKS